MKNKTPEWLKEAIFYQIYPQSFFDTNGDGIGDIKGIIQKLDYIQDLGVNALWLNPCFVSPFQDAGYDIADYYKVAPRYGTNTDLKNLIKKAHNKGIKVCLDLVPGHTSIEHPWFKSSCEYEPNIYTDRYIWTNSMWDGNDDKIKLINGYADRDGSYATNFFYCQPALNYGFAKPDSKKKWQQGIDAPGPKATRKELKNIINYWLQQGADGFRVDMAGTLIKNDKDKKETIKLWKEIREWMYEKYPNAVLIAEWGNPQEAISAGFDIDFMIHFGVSGYEHLLLEDDCFFRGKEGKGIKNFLNPYFEQVAKTKGRGYVSIPTANHDYKRLRSDGRTLADLKVIFTMLITWPGIPFIYYGDEIGMRYLENLPSKEGGYDRTGTRTPMQWDETKNSGFSMASLDDLYIPIDPRKRIPNVKAQEKNSRSLLNHVKKIIKLRKCSKALQADGELIPIYSKRKEPPFVYLRKYKNEKFLIAINPSVLEKEISLSKVEANNSMLELGKGVKCLQKKNGTTLKMRGVSYGIFNLENELNAN
jgi:maltose alpha-D-glucosyltransferase/alpha-amylase